MLTISPATSQMILVCFCRCFSNVGRQGSFQRISIARDFEHLHITVHEIGKTIIDIEGARSSTSSVPAFHSGAQRVRRTYGGVTLVQSPTPQPFKAGVHMKAVFLSGAQRVRRTYGGAILDQSPTPQPFKAGVHMKAVFWLVIMVLSQIPR